MREESRILVIDDYQGFLVYMRDALSGAFAVTTVNCSADAIDAIIKGNFDAAVVDVDLKEELTGIDLARMIRDADPGMAIILITATPDLYKNSGIYFEDYIVKGSPESTSDYLLIAILKNAIYQRSMSAECRIKRLELLRKLLPYKDKIIDFHRLVAGDHDGTVEKLTGTWRDKNFVSWVVYNLPQHDKNSFTVGVASMAGCGLKCRFCLSGYEPIIRKLDWTEIVCQVLYGLDSFHAKGIFETPRRLQPQVNFTCEGEPFMNLENVIRAIRELSAVSLDFQFIITSIGLEKELKIFLEKHTDLSNVRHYWSVNFCDPFRRVQIMPATRNHNLFAVRDLYQKIAEKTGSMVTASFVLIPGANDRPKDAEDIVELFGHGRPFQVKLQPYQSPEEYRCFDTPTIKQLKSFQEQLVQKGIDCRIREVVGSDSFAGCGSTVPGHYPKVIIPKS